MLKEEKLFCVYFMTNKTNTVLYVGVTSNLKQRVYEHILKVRGGFTVKYNINKLVYYEIFENAEQGILREKQIKAGSRRKKLELIEKGNPHWNDLTNELG